MTVDATFAVFEYWKAGRRVDRVQPKPGGYEDTRIRLTVAEREESGELDGWYAAGTYQPPAPEPAKTGPAARRSTTTRKPAQPAEE